MYQRQRTGQQHGGRSLHVLAQPQPTSLRDDSRVCAPLILPRLGSICKESRLLTIPTTQTVDISIHTPSGTQRCRATLTSTTSHFFFLLVLCCSLASTIFDRGLHVSRCALTAVCSTDLLRSKCESCSLFEHKSTRI